MSLRFDVVKYLGLAKDFVKPRYLLLQNYLKPKLQFILQQIHCQKAILLKVSVPFVIILIGFYGCTSSQRRIAKNVADIFVISDEIRHFYQAKPTYWGLSGDAVVQGKYISPRFIRTQTIHLSGGEKVLIGDGANGEVVMPGSTLFDISLSGLNKAQCIAYAESTISEENQVNLVKISILNGSGDFTFEWGNTKYPLPIKKYDSKDICSDKNTLIWTFH